MRKKTFHKIYAFLRNARAIPIRSISSRESLAPPSLPELAAIAGTNEFKLKKGFKEVFNNTVFGYLSDARLAQAKELLLAGYPIKEVADRLGYSSVQHFGNAFRKKFSMPPGRIGR